MIPGLLEHFAEVENFRCEGLVSYPLQESLLGALAGTRCGARDWQAIAIPCHAPVCPSDLPRSSRAAFRFNRRSMSNLPSSNPRIPLFRCARL